MGKLTIEEIKKLAMRKGVKRIAVENFLMTVMNNADERNAWLNLGMDSNMYKWNAKTVKTIGDGIKLAFQQG